jgi:hypothetical protein
MPSDLELSHTSTERYTAPSADGVMHLLDTEIERITAEKERKGWSSFAVLGALAALSWTALGLWEEGGFQVRECVLWSLFLLAVREVVRYVYIESGEMSWRPSGQRFAATRHLAQLRDRIPEELGYAALFLGLVFVVGFELPLWGVVAVLLYWVPTIVSAILMLFTHRLGVFLPVNSTLISRFFSGIRIVNVFLLGAFISAVFSMLTIPTPGSKSLAFKVALLFVGILELTRVLLVTIRRPRFLDSLLEIRRDLVV